MQIEEQIKRLLRVKAKIDLYRKVMDNVNNELASVSQDAEHKALELDHPGLIKEFCEEISKYCTRSIENLNETAVPNATPKPTNAVVVVEERPTVPEVEKKLDPEEEPTDPLRFLLKYKKLDGKRVRFMSKDGEVQATVRGLVVPNIVVETDTGFTLKIKPLDLTVIS